MVMGTIGHGTSGLAWIVAAGVAAGQASFVDRTTQAGLDAVHQPPGGVTSSPMIAGAGAVDVDGDGWQDVLVCMGGGAPDRLYVNDGDGTFTDRAADWGVDAAHLGAGVAVGDVEADGDPDLFVASHGGADGAIVGAHRLYRNDGAAFVEVAAAAGVDTTSRVEPDGYGATFGDPDLDGDLDLFVTGWVEGSGGNRLFANDGDGVFTDATTDAILADLSALRGFSPAFCDMDDDGWPELLVAGDFGTSRYLVNQGDGTFVDATASSGTGLDSNGMGHALGDVDGDGDLDWYVTSIFADDGSGSGNVLYLSDGDHAYTEAGAAAGVDDGGWGWGALAVDVDHDGALDLVETNGWPVAEWTGEQAYLFLNDGGGVFGEAALASGLSYVQDGLGLLRFDGDGDGDQDLLFTANAGPLRYFRNELDAPDAHWLQLAFESGGAPGVAPHGLGVMAWVTTGATTRRAALTGAPSYLTASALDLHVGLGAAQVVDALRVRWPDGTLTDRVEVAADQRVVLVCCDGWTPLGAGLAGEAGVPALAGAGPLVAGATITLELTGAAPDAAATLVVGFGALSVSFKGGTLVPAPDLLVAAVTDAEGAWSLSASWPAGVPAGASTWWQAWIVDASGPSGMTASGGLRATTP